MQIEATKKQKTTSIVDRVEAFFDKEAPLVERLTEAERERDFYKQKLGELQSKIRFFNQLIEKDSSMKPPQYVTLTSDQMDVAKIAFPDVTPEKAYQNYVENVLILRNEGRINNGDKLPNNAWCK